MPDLSPAAGKFILHWGEMGTRWGINRTVAQIHALLFLSPEPLPADVIAETLQVARSNVSVALKELQNWRLLRVVHVLGDRRDHFETGHDVWEMFRTITDERWKREIEPTIALLEETVGDLASSRESPRIRRGLSDLLEFFRVTSSFYAQIRRLPTPALVKAAGFGDRLLKLLGVRTKGGI